MRDNLVIIEGTKFIYKTNFSGDPDRDTYGNTQRKGNLLFRILSRQEDLSMKASMLN